ncbi:hypothetical protein ACIBPB_32855 [Micromonospora sp. NPDC049836]|uniref:hypothetical protein n=1 Tax=Micromonospora TaxID=1873 RepID=UPI0004C0A46E|nr:hypothetical protein [Micromonospora globosa]
MRELSGGDLGMLLSVFALLLIAFGIDFHLSRSAIRRSRRGAIFASIVSLVGESTTALALVLTWIALWSPVAWEKIDDLLVFIPGTIAVVCAVLLTGDRALDRVIRIAARSDGSSGTDDG